MITIDNKFLPRNKSLKSFSSNLRNNATPEEKKLWFNFLRNYQIQFNRQRIIGNYIVDFYCDKAKLAVEIDGSQHFEESGLKNDTERTNYLNDCGVRVIRFTNDEVNHSFYEVCSVIDNTVKNIINEKA